MLQDALAICKEIHNPHNKLKSHYNPLSPILASKVRRRRSSRALRSDISLGHTAIDDEVATVDEASLIARQKQHSLSLLDSLTKAAGGEVDGAPLALGLVVAEPVLQQRGVEGRGAEGVEAEALAGVHDGQLARHGEHGALGSRVGELGGGGADERDHGRRVDDAAFGLLVLAEGEDGVLAAEPHALDVDVLRHVPDLLGGVDGVWDWG